jgi:hypothetical protein
MKVIHGDDQAAAAGAAHAVSAWRACDRRSYLVSVRARPRTQPTARDRTR